MHAKTAHESAPGVAQQALSSLIGQEPKQNQFKDFSLKSLGKPVGIYVDSR